MAKQTKKQKIIELNEEYYISVKKIETNFPNGWVTVHSPKFDKIGNFLGGNFLYGGKNYEKAHQVIQKYPASKKKN